MSDAIKAQTIETAEAQITYRDVGSGPVLLALHGGGPGATGWGNFGRNALDLRDQYRVIAPDQPGFGDSKFTNDLGGEYHTTSARIMFQLLDKLGIQQAHVLGNSMGGGVAMRMAMQSPERVGKLVLMGPYFRGLGHQFLAPQHEGDAHLMHYFPNPSLEKMRALIRTFVYDPATIEGIEDVIKARYEMTLRPEIQAGYMRMAKKVADPDTRSSFDKVASIAHQALLLWGRDDKFCHLEQAFFLMAALRNAELVVLKNTGHWFQVERPKEFSSYVRSFLARA